MDNQKKTIGIIGGMGPAATALLFQKIIEYTDAAKDSDHIHILIDNYPQVPDRTASIKRGSDEPVDYICKAGERLISIGAELLIIPCNTSHYFFDKIQRRLSVPVINMIAETAKVCREKGYSKVGVLATDGTKETGIFEKELALCGIDVIPTTDEGQKEVMSVIYDQVKAGNLINTERLSFFLREMKDKGAEAFVLGCTELSVALNDGAYGFDFVDTLKVLAKSAIVQSGYKHK